MGNINIQTSKPVVPKIYAYTTPEIARHDGWTKIGYTEQDDVKKRIDQQTHTADVTAKLEWQGNAVYEGTNETFKDKEFHEYLRKLGFEQENGKQNEWFKIMPMDAKKNFYDFRENHGQLDASMLPSAMPYELRDEQKDAVVQTKNYHDTHENGEFLWNAKPRFGKTLTVYDFCKTIKAKKVLIVTNRPAVSNSWYSDYMSFMGKESGYVFVSSDSNLKGKSFVLTREEFLGQQSDSDDMARTIEFVSLQDLKGSIYFGGQHEKLKEVADIEWDVLVIDEAHEAIDTVKTDVAFDRIKCKFTLHLSGTPFKQLSNDKFGSDAIFNWTYADEQKKKHELEDAGNSENPYSNLPQLNMFTYRMSDIVKDKLAEGIDIDGNKRSWAFDLNEFFAVKDDKFVHEEAVDKFLDALTSYKKFPFSTPELRNELKHTFWFLNRVDSAKCLEVKLRNHPVFKEYEIVLAAGDGKKIDTGEYDAAGNAKAFHRVKDAIANHDKTITLSVGQLTTGVTIPEWTAVLMLCNCKSPAIYMQTAFRAQNPCLFHIGDKHFRKENAYVFDFDPARTLTIFEEFANDLSADTAVGRGDLDTRKAHVKELLNFFPVIGEDEKGEMIELDAEKVLSIPVKIHAQEVVKSGFMNNFLFQNIGGIFASVEAVQNILNKLTAVGKDEQLTMTKEKGEELAGDVTEEHVIGQTQNLFGDKLYDIETEFSQRVQDIMPTEDGKPLSEVLKDMMQPQLDGITSKVSKEYGLSNASATRLNKQITDVLNKKIDLVAGRHEIARSKLNKEQEKLDKELKDGAISEDDYLDKAIDIERMQNQLKEDMKANITETLKGFARDAAEKSVRAVETQKHEIEKKNEEDKYRDKLRGFCRTIPLFLMAYGDENTSLKVFDQVVPADVFETVTSITLDDFRFLRDGGDYEEDGITKHFDGHVFDEVVFNDSCKEFLRLRSNLADYFDENQTEDIFDYIPPQNTTLIFTPKSVASMMCDMLEKENPNCFDDDTKTFIDIYMKSGLYPAEIIKRLFKSKKMKALYPDANDRLRHIIGEQVYGLAPTEIIYKIATNYILGFDKDGSIIGGKHHFRQYDSLPAAKSGTLEQELDKVFAE